MTETTIAPASERQAERLVLRHDRGAVRELVLNRPKARNALSEALLDQLEEEFAQLAEAPDIRVVVLSANGPVFCSGHDLRELHAGAEDGCPTTFKRSGRLMVQIRQLQQPVIAKVQGLATAAGCQLVAACDLVIAAEEASFATPGVRLGLFCSTPAVSLSRAVSEKAAMEMLLTGEPVTAARARELGLVNRVVAADQLESEVAGLAERIAAASAVALRLGKASFYRQLGLPLAEAYDEASAVMSENLRSQDAAEGIDAFLGKRSPRWRHQ